MRRGIHLRTRVFILTGLGASLLIFVTAVLTSGSRSTERQFRELVEKEVSTERAVTEAARLLASWQRRWIAQGDGAAPEEIRNLALDLRSVATSAIDGIPEHEPWSAPLTSLDARVWTTAEQWESMGRGERSQALQTVAAEASGAIHSLGSFAEAKDREIEAKLDELSRTTEDAIWVALAFTWIIVIVSFAVARRTLDKVVVPLEKLAEASRRLAAGDADARAPIGGDLEIADLGTTFNEMAESLTASNRALAERARTDELTGLPNYRAFSETLTLEIERAKRFDYSFGLVLIDVDHFKRFNDTYGHQAGNEALQLVADMVAASIRAVDTAARFGGEEIAVILPQVGLDTLYATAERIRKAIEAQPALPGTSRLTVSIGGALYPEAGDHRERLFEVADAMLYRAKNRGRNRTEIYSEEGVIPHPRSGKGMRKASRRS